MDLIPRMALAKHPLIHINDETGNMQSAILQCVCVCVRVFYLAHGLQAQKEQGMEE